MKKCCKNCKYCKYEEAYLCYACNRDIWFSIDSIVSYSCDNFKPKKSSKSKVNLTKR